MDRLDVILVAMPWASIHRPSIQLGTLQPVLERSGFTVSVFSFYLAAIEYFAEATAWLPDRERIAVSDYYLISDKYRRLGLGDWVFAVPPYAEFNIAQEEEYFSLLRSVKVPESLLAKIRRLRELVPVFLEQCAKNILTESPRMVGFTTSFSQNVPSLVLAKILKSRDPSVQILFGGANCDGPMGAALHRAFPWVDIVVRGEGEYVLPRLIEDLVMDRAIRPQLGICYRMNGESIAVDQPGVETVLMDSLPTPTYDEYFGRLQRSSLRSQILPNVKLLFESSRGCWWGALHHCTFCGLNGSNMNFRSKSAARVYDEVIGLSERYREADLAAVDNIVDMKYMVQLLPRLRQLRDEGIDIRLFYETKANLKKEHLQLMRDAGVHTIQPGIESLSTPILKLMRKGVTALQNIRLLKWCAQYDIEVYWNLIYGFPGEPPEEYARMADLIRSLTHLEPPTWTHLAIERFSPYYQDPKAFGLELIGPLQFYRFIYKVDEATLSDLAYDFEYRYADSRNPAAYIQPTMEVVSTWREHYQKGQQSLTCRRGPGFLEINDRRYGLEPNDYLFEGLSADIYLACDSGATPIAIWKSLCTKGVTTITVEHISCFLEELVRERLVYEEDGCYLSLALPRK